MNLICVLTIISLAEIVTSCNYSGLVGDSCIYDCDCKNESTIKCLTGTCQLVLISLNRENFN